MKTFYLAVGALALIAKQVVAAEGSFALFPNRDSGGGNFQTLQTKDEASCRSECSQNARCTGYTWKKPGNPNDKGFCYLKDACSSSDLTKTSTDSTLFSGVIAKSCNDVMCGTKKVNVKPGTCIEPMPEPSGKTHYRRRAAALEAKRSMQMQLCPLGSNACYLGSLASSGYECVNLQEELERCGSCTNDCTAKPGVSAVTCREGKCIVQACAPTFAFVETETGGECKPNLDASSSRRRSRA